MFRVEVRQGSTARTVETLVVSPRHEPLSGSGRDWGHGELAESRLKPPNYWGDGIVPPELWRKIVDDSSHGNLFSENVDDWSPLGQLNRDLFGSFSDDIAVQDDLDREDGVPSGGEIIIGAERPGLLIPEIGLRGEDGDPLGAVVFSSYSCIAVIPAGTEEFRLTYEPTADDELAEDSAALDALAAYPGDLQRGTVWRTYYGNNTQVTDAVSPAGEWVKAVVLFSARTAGVVVFRPFLSRAKDAHPQRDPLRHKRLRKALREDDQFEYYCPDLRDVKKAEGNLVIAVHGTMTCGVPMARAIQEVVDDVAVVRFEHDTWTRIPDNVEELVAILDTCAAERITLIGHSRGGLVAYKAAGDTSHPNVQVVTLGSPYRGTPIAYAAALPLLGYRCLLGLIRHVGRRIPGVDLATRLAGFLIRKVPIGIEQMNVDNTWMYKGPPPKVVAAISGNVTADSLKDTWTCHFLSKSQAFDGEANDLVVGQRSASGDHLAPIVVECDHFSFFEEQSVKQVIGKIVGSERGDVQVGPPWWSRGEIDW